MLPLQTARIEDDGSFEFNGLAAGDYVVQVISNPGNAAGGPGGAGVLAALTMGDKILTLIFRPEYAGSGGVFARIMLAGGVGYVVSGQGYAMTAARSLMPQIPLGLCAAASTALFAWWLVPLRGLSGAAEAWLLGSLIQLAMSTALLARMGKAQVSTGRDRHLSATTTVPADAA